MAEISRTAKSLELEQARRLQAAASQRDEFDWMALLFTPSLNPPASPLGGQHKNPLVAGLVIELASN